MTLTLENSTHSSGSARITELRSRFRPVFEQIAQSALTRELERQLPYDQVRLLADSGFTALTVPQDYGGENISIPELIELLIDLAEADSNLPQILHAHFAFTEIHRTSPQLISEWWLQQVGTGKIISNGMVSGQDQDRVEGQTGARIFTGSKVYSTGALFSDYLFILTGFTASGAPQLHVVPTAQAGIELVDDWDGLGQRLTGSGTTHFEKVPLDESKILDIESPAGSLVGPLVLLIHAATQAGIAANAVSDAATYVRNRRRTYGRAAAEYPKDDPQVQEVVGRAASHAYAAKAVVRHAALDLAERFTRAEHLGDAASDESRNECAEALIDAGQFSSVVSDHAQAATTLLFEAGGATVLQRKYGFDRHWRNTRVLASHNPAHFKLRSVGDFLINGNYPSTDSYARPVRATDEPTASGQDQSG